MTSKELQESSVISLASTQVLIEELKQRVTKKATEENASGIDIVFIAIEISMSEEKIGREDEIRLITEDGQIFTYPINRF